MKKFFAIVNLFVIVISLFFIIFSFNVYAQSSTPSPTSISPNAPSNPISLLLDLLNSLFNIKFSQGTTSISPTLPPPQITLTLTPPPLPSNFLISPTPSSQPPNLSLVYYCQHNVAWKYACGSNLNACIPNNQCGLGYAGCGPTSLAMIISTLVTKMTPPEVDAVFQQYGWRAGCGAGSNMYSALTSSWLSSLGLKTGLSLVSGTNLNLNLVKNFIDNGAIIIASSTQFPCQSCAKPTLIDHIFVIDNVDVVDNTVSIRDPDNCSWWDGDLETKPLIMSVTTFPWYYAFPVNKI